MGVAIRGRFYIGGATEVVSELPGHDRWVLGVASNDGLDVVLEGIDDGAVRVEKIMGSSRSEVANVGVNPTYCAFRSQISKQSLAICIEGKYIP